jgi:hypothetical protein
MAPFRSFLKITLFVTALFLSSVGRCQLLFSDSEAYSLRGYIDIVQLTEDKGSLIVIVDKGNSLSGHKRYFYNDSTKLRLDLINVKESLGYNILFYITGGSFFAETDTTYALLDQSLKLVRYLPNIYKQVHAPGNKIINFRIDRNSNFILLSTNTDGSSPKVQLFDLSDNLKVTINTLVVPNRVSVSNDQHIYVSGIDEGIHQAYVYDSFGNLILNKSGFLVGDFNEDNEMMMGSTDYSRNIISIKFLDRELNEIYEIAMFSLEENSSLTHISPHFSAKKQWVRTLGPVVSVFEIDYSRRRLVLSTEGPETSQLSVYPNPFYTDVRVVAPKSWDCSFTLYNAQGQKIISFDKIPESIDLVNLPSGIYIFRTGNGAFVKAFKQ